MAAEYQGDEQDAEADEEEVEGANPLFVEQVMGEPYEAAEEGEEEAEDEEAKEERVAVEDDEEDDGAAEEAE